MFLNFVFLFLYIHVVFEGYVNICRPQTRVSIETLPITLTSTTYITLYIEFIVNQYS